jgi:hypothetical protein
LRDLDDFSVAMNEKFILVEKNVNKSFFGAKPDFGYEIMAMR